MVTYVRTRYDDSSAYRDVLRQIGETTIEMQHAMEREALSAFLRCVEKNQVMLSQLGVVSESTEKLISTLRDIGAVAKVTGAGGRQEGSGMALVFHEDPDTLLEFCKRHEYDYLETTIEHGRLI
jgi:mevalonate kinase